MSARHRLILAAALALLTCGLLAVTGAAVPILAVTTVALAAVAVAAPAQPGTYRRRSTTAAPDAGPLPSGVGAGGGPYPEGVTS